MPLSPPPSNSGELLQPGVQQLIQHNMTTLYPLQSPYTDGSYQHSHYNSPTPTEGNDGVYLYSDHQSMYDYSSQNSEMGMTTPYKESSYSSDYNGSTYQDRFNTPATSPTNHVDTMKTRSGLGIPRGRQLLRPMPEGRARTKDSPKPRRSRKGKLKAEKRVAKLEQPLSVLTKDWTHIPIVDIEAYVNRPIEVRRSEVVDGKNPGKVKRPMNSFMLYRKAYQNRTKDWCLQNNHQIVSQVCGDSWPLEPDEIKERFSEWAKIERINHQRAHPGYKFSPTKPGTTKSGKRKISEEITTEESDLEDYDWRRGASSRRGKKARSTSGTLEPPVLQPVLYPSTQSAYQYSSRNSSPEPVRGVYHQSSYQINNPGRPLPALYQPQLKDGEYYQQSLQHYHILPGTQDVILKKTSTPEASHAYLIQPLTDVHGYDILHTFPPLNDYQSYQKIDPSLMETGHQYATNHLSDTMHDAYSIPKGLHEDSNLQQPSQSTVRGMQGQDPVLSFLNTTTEPGSHSHVGVMPDHRSWHDTLETGNEFDKWMDEEHPTPS